MADPLWINASAGTPAYNAAELRQGMALPLMYDGRVSGARQGVRPGGPALQVTLAVSTITVATGCACVDPGLSTAQGPYWVALPAAETHTLAAANATNPRKDIVILRVYDNDEDSSGLRTARSEYLVGVAGASPSEPAVPAGAVRLATIDVPQSGGGAAVVTDRRPWTVAAGGILPVANQAARDALSPYDGQYVHRLDTGALEGRSGGQWQVRAIAPISLEATATASPQAISASTVTAITWQAASENVGGFTKPSGFEFTVPAAGLYVATVQGLVSNGQSGRAFVNMVMDGRAYRASFGGVSESGWASTGQRRMAASTIVKAEIFCATATTIASGTLSVYRVGA
ncbi:hypothetical protein ACN261_31525 [Micromonospora sp. WMMD723]|uniref:hypothetical protein n=2 Tax=Micromonospora sp. WMMD723 TaxID=3403465 RepID=UPI003CE87A31